MPQNVIYFYCLLMQNPLNRPVFKTNLTDHDIVQFIDQIQEAFEQNKYTLGVSLEH